MRAGTESALALITAAVLLAAPGPAAAQGFLEQFSYEGLRFSGIGVDVGGVLSDRLESDVTAALHVDYGYIAPNLRTLFGVSWFQSRFNDEEIATFEQRLEAIVNDPAVSIDVGDIEWTNVTLDLDLQYMFGPARRITPYAGLGIGVHIRNASGEAIAGTFVEDALDTVAAGLNLSTGAEITIARNLRFTLDVRGLLTSGLLGVTGRAGFMVRLPRGATP